MRIAVFTNTFRPFLGGVTRSVETLARELRARGHALQLFAPRFEGEEEPKEWICRVPAIPRFNHTDFSLPLPFSLKVRSVFKKFAPDLVHVQHPFLLGEMGMHLGKNRGLPIVLTYHTQYEKYSHYVPIDSPWVRRCIVNVCTSFCNICDLVVAPSRDIEKILKKRGVRTRIVVIPTGVDLPRYRNPDRQWLRKRLGLRSDEKILVHVGRLSKEKNLDFLIQAVAQAMEKRKNLLFLVAGEGDQKPRIEQQARLLGIRDRTIFQGKLTSRDLVNTYAGGDIFVFSSKTETQGLVVLEAMAAGTPVVAMDAPGVRDMIEDGVQGFLTPEDPHLFSERILELIESSEKYTACSEASLKRAESFSAARMAERVLQEYCLLLKKPPESLNREIHHFRILMGILQESLRKGKP